VSGARTTLLRVLVVFSGACALAYQLVWTRELRLVFGHSTAASAAVLAIFVGGLGFGSLRLGPRADRHPRPLLFYARLEALIAASAAFSPVLLRLVESTYIFAGGSATLGVVLATPLRLILAALVLGVPTFLMGGTLPAAARFVEGAGDERRHQTALLYGLNTLGAATGAFVVTFAALERFGDAGTLRVACAVNLAVALVAWVAGRGIAEAETSAAEAEAVPRPALAPRAFVLSAAAVVGFVFFLLELVWYRMLGPLLGGTVFAFGLILAMALVGIALGGLAYGLVGEKRPVGLQTLSTTCLVEAIFVAVPLALGDRLAVGALLVRPLAHAGWTGQVLAWVLVAAPVVLPVALVAGYQFPLLIALLGRGHERVGRDVGHATALNTAGAILGALAGGFGLLPLLTAPGCWRLAAALLVGLGLASALLARRPLVRLPIPLLLALCVVSLLQGRGPTGAFRHSGIGAGRATLPEGAGPIEIEDWLREARRSVVYEAEGVESSFAIVGSTGLAFSINGKVDGHSRYDAPTQVMAGLLGALLHHGPTRALVVGLGTGSTAGWLAEVPGMERVDVVELEPAVVEMARRCAPLNQDVLNNPRVRLIFADAREALLTSGDRYDLIVSEPSNPYRAGVASLFTREFYDAVSARLDENGLFLQWLQAYEIDAVSMRSLYRSLLSALPVVQTWQTHTRDLLLVASRNEGTLDLDELARRIAREPYRSALRLAWGTDSVEGVLARFVGTKALARRLGESAPINTDDRNGLEFGFARSLGAGGPLDVETVRRAAIEIDAALPATRGGSVDLVRIEDERLGIWSGAGESPKAPTLELPGLAQRARAHALWSGRQRTAAWEAWASQDQPPRGPVELALVAEASADVNDPAAEGLIEQLRVESPTEADACLARLRLRQGRHEEALSALDKVFSSYRHDPWPSPLLMQGALDAALELGGQRVDLAPRVRALLEEPFALRMLDAVRVEEAFLLESLEPPGPGCARTFEPLEPDVPFDAEWLERRVRCYLLTDHPLFLEAREDRDRFEALTPSSLLDDDPDRAADPGVTAR